MKQSLVSKGNEQVTILKTGYNKEKSGTNGTTEESLQIMGIGPARLTENRILEIDQTKTAKRRREHTDLFKTDQLININSQMPASEGSNPD